jgi:hypothetical protein
MNSESAPKPGLLFKTKGSKALVSAALTGPRKNQEHIETDIKCSRLAVNPKDSQG